MNEVWLDDKIEALAVVTGHAPAWFKWHGLNQWSFHGTPYFVLPIAEPRPAGRPSWWLLGTHENLAVWQDRSR